MICTIEKANGIVNRLLQKGYGHTIGCIIFDEMHVLGSSFNGYLLEILVRFVVLFLQLFNFYQSFIILIYL